MLAHRNSLYRFMLRVVQLCILILFAAGCSVLPTVLPVSPSGTSQPQPTPSPTEYTKAEVVFEAHLPASLAEGQNLFIEILDEVTGLALNSARVQMTSTDQQNFIVRLPVVIGSVLKYRYVRDQDPIGIEYTSLGQQVRYRMVVVHGPTTVQDTIAAWKVQPVSGKTGRINGQVAIKGSNEPVLNALVTAGGMHTFTNSDGSFLLEGLPEGLHNMVVYSPDGTFRAFQQGAIVAPDATTPALITIEKDPSVSVTFVVSQPDPSIKGVPIRLVGNIVPLGNSFADLRAGMSTVAARAPFLTYSSDDGHYSITLKLSPGFDLRYKYTLGDGYWNAERYPSGAVRLRQLIVPDSDITIEDSIDSWRTPGIAPVTFTVSVPENTPPSDTISIQFNPFSWTEPIPMWPLGNNRWLYLLQNPLNEFSKASYRYCRNDQCGVADAAETAGASAAGIEFAPQNEPLEIEDVVSAWAWTDASSELVTVSAATITARENNFVTGVEFTPGYHPSWQSYLPAAFQNIQDIGANTAVLTPTWQMTHQIPPVIELVPGKNPLWSDLTVMISQLQQRKLDAILHPIIQFPQDPSDWWQSAPRDDGWWQSWFDRYQTYLVYHADLAAQTGAKALIIGDENLLPSLPGGLLADGSPSGVPGNSEERWLKLIAAVRARYKGELIWMVPYSSRTTQVPAFVEQLDQVYVQFSTPLTDTDQITGPELETRIAAILDSEILPIQEHLKRPVLLGLRYPSVSGALDGCVESDGVCLPGNAFFRPAAQYSGVELSMNEQADVYSAFLTALNQRSWIDGFIAVGYYLPVQVKDASISVRTKSASDVLWYWYPRLLGKLVSP